MTKDFVISLVIVSTLDHDEISKITACDADRFSPAGAIVSPYRSADTSVWIRYPPLRSATLDDELGRTAAWIRSFQPLHGSCKLTVTVLFREAGEGFFPVIIQGETVRSLLQMGVRLDFDDVLLP